MDSVQPTATRTKLVAYTAPMAAFLLLLAVNSVLKTIGGGFWLTSAEYWLYPLQTLICGALLIIFWRHFEFGPARGILLSTAIAVLVFVLWISPQALLGFGARTDGFNPNTFAAQPTLYWATVAFRFLRLVVVVPLVEEIFWRGFLLRYLIDERFERVPIGAFSWVSFIVVTVLFCFAHSQADWIAAAITGALYNAVAYRTKSLTSCVLTHALTNLLLGIWIMRTAQWGFW